jgi:hypothetical protein
MNITYGTKLIVLLQVAILMISMLITLSLVKHIEQKVDWNRLSILHTEDLLNNQAKETIRLSDLTENTLKDVKHNQEIIIKNQLLILKKL